MARGIAVAFQAALLFTLLLAPTVFGGLHRYGAPDLLLLVCLLLAFWVVSSLQGLPLRHARSPANICIWGILGLLLFQVCPLPRVGVIGRGPEAFGALRDVLVNMGYVPRWRTEAYLPVGRYSVLPGMTVGVLVLAVSAAGLYWLVGSAATGRKVLRRATWVVMAGLTLLAAWVVVSGLKSLYGPANHKPYGGGGPVLVLGGDSLVPALLAALPLGLLVVLRSLGGTPRLEPHRRQSRLGWLGRARTVWGGIGLAMTALVAVALGISHVPWVLCVGCALLSAAFVLGGYLGSAAHRFGRRRAVWLVLALLVGIIGAITVGARLGGERFPAAGADERLEGLWGAMSPQRVVLGAGGGTVSPAAAFGTPGWPAEPGGDSDTNGYRLLRIEIGLLGVALVLACAAAFAIHGVKAWRCARSPWTHLAPPVGLGVLAANLLYFGFDASALLAPNLLAMATVLGVVTAWSGYGANWRPGRARDLAEAHWPFVAGAVGLLAAFGLAEKDMLGAAGTGISDKVLHFGTFAVVSLLLCYALGPHPGTHRLKMRIVLAVCGTAAMGVVMEFGQLYLTGGRAFEAMDIVANITGAALMGLLWWVFRRGQTLAPLSEARSA